MIVPLKTVRLHKPIDSHDQRNQLTLEKRYGWECALDEEKRFILVRHTPRAEGVEPWQAEFGVENAAHWVRDAQAELGERVDAAIDSFKKGKKR